MMNRLSPLQQRLLAIVLLLLLLASVFVLIVQPITGRYQQANEQIESLTEQISRYQAISDSRSQLEQRLAQLQQETKESGYLLKGRTDALLSANLQQYLKQLVTRSGGKLIRVQALETTKTGPLDAVRLRVHLQAELSQMLVHLNELQRSGPLLIIEQLTISAKRVRPLRSTGKAFARPLDIQFLLTGYTTQEVQL